MPHNILLCVTGGIAAYKSISLLRLLQKDGADVKVVLTPAALDFVTVTTFEALSGHPVAVEGVNLSHIELANWADLVVIAPATANTIAKIAAGFADNLLCATILATKSPIIIFPAMNVNMLTNPATQDNFSLLRRRGYFVADTSVGQLACGVIAQGKLPEPDEMMEIIREQVKGEYAGLKILVTAGPTVETIDPVRYISNRSSGKMGYAIAEAAARKGAEVTLISGPVALKPPVDKVINVQSTAEMLYAVVDRIEQCDILVMCAAVADFRVVAPAEQKIKKNGEEGLTLELVKNDDILKTVAGCKRDNQVFVGFAAESENLRENATQKLAEKRLDMIVANDISRKDIGFNVDENEITIYYSDNRQEEITKRSKSAVAEIVVDRAVAAWKR